MATTSHSHLAWLNSFIRDSIDVILTRRSSTQIRWSQQVVKVSDLTVDSTFIWVDCVVITHNTPHK